MLPHEDKVLNKFRIWKESHVQMRENRSSHLVWWKTHPTILPQPGFELTTSRTLQLQTWSKCPASNHSATTAVIQIRYNTISFYCAKILRNLSSMACQTIVLIGNIVSIKNPSCLPPVQLWVRLVNAGNLAFFHWANVLPWRILRHTSLKHKTWEIYPMIYHLVQQPMEGSCSGKWDELR